MPKNTGRARAVLKVEWREEGSLSSDIWTPRKIKMMRSLASDGWSQRDTAGLIGVSEKSVVRKSDELGILFAGSKKAKGGKVAAA